MEWQQLKYFQEVAKTEHIGKASANLHVTQPAVSMSIKRLEDELGIELFERNKNSISLNKYGKVYLKYVESALKDLEDGHQLIQSIKKDEDNRVTVMMPEKILTPEVTSRLMSEIPDILLQNLSIDYTVCMQGLKDGMLDFSILANLPSYEGITSIPLEKQSMCIITSKNHPLSNRSEMNLSELAEENFVSYTENTTPRIHFEGMCKKAGFKPKVPFECNYLKTMLGPVMAGYGIALVSYSTALAFEKSGYHYVKIKDDFVYVILALNYRNDKPMKPVAERAKNILLEFYPPIEI